MYLILLFVANFVLYTSVYALNSRGDFFRSRIFSKNGGLGGFNGPPSNNGPPLFMSEFDNVGNDSDSSSSSSCQQTEESEPNEVAKGLKGLWESLSIENRDDIKTTSVSFLFALLLRLFIVEPRFIPSLSMFPTFEVGDQLLVDKVSKRMSRPYQRRDVVVFNPSESYIELTGNTEALIKRIVAVEGDTLEVKGNRLYVNGEMQDEPYINEFPAYALDKMLVPKGMLLVLGDNRNYSFDSHIWGFLPQENVIGRAVVKYWPPWRIGGVEGSS
jgi:signal peptidase I